ncbi:MAG: hypothetical protein F7C38_04890 [Desulfurococcales archaeon]|nr:hypothetical protein [Desulfurococcales archaeon]
METEDEALARAVELILQAKTEEALELLSKHYKIATPRLKIGLPKKCRRALGCYTPRDKTIHLRSSSEYTNPFIVLHEYYHHLRYRLGTHRGTERHADQYALKAINAWKKLYATEA